LSEDAGRRQAVGIDYGGTHLRAALVDASGHITRRRRRGVPPSTAARISAPAEACLELATDAAAVGLAVAGTVRAGVLTWSAHLGLTDVRFAELVTAATALPTVVVNDARAAGFAEAMLGEAHGRGVTLYVSVGTGIGGAIVVDRRLLTGSGHAGEIGHIGVDPDGPPCACGRRGCWEQLAGGGALDRVAATVLAGQQPGGSRAPSARHVIAAANLGDDAARDAIRRAARAFAAGLDSVCAVLSPDRVVLGGGIITRGGTLAEHYLRAASQLRWSHGPLTTAALGDDAGTIGAALLALRVAGKAGTGQSDGIGAVAGIGLPTG
jgi:glucokinase